MASKSHFFLFFLLILVTILGSNGQNEGTFNIPITLDTETKQYYATFKIGTPQNDVKAVIDLGGKFLSLGCDKYKSSTRPFIPCKSTKCQDIRPQVCGSDNICSLPSFNPFTISVTSSRLSNDVVTVHETDGKPSWIKTYSTPLDILCVNSSKLSGLAKGTDGIFGLGRTRLWSTQLISAFNTIPKFALCLPSSNKFGFGDLFLGRGPYLFPGGEDPYNWISYTLLLRSSNSDEYFLPVKSIKVDKKVVHFDSSLLDLNTETGAGGTKITTSAPYSILRSSIYKAVVDAFVKSAAARNITRVAAVKPFGACFSIKGVHWTKAGPRVPLIDLGLTGNMQILPWTIYGANSMVRVNKNTLCLGFIDGGLKARNSIVLGGHQLEDNFLLFDLTSSMIGFSSSLLPRGASCSHFRNL